MARAQIPSWPTWALPLAEAAELPTVCPDGSAALSEILYVVGQLL